MFIVCQLSDGKVCKGKTKQLHDVVLRASYNASKTVQLLKFNEETNGQD